MYGLESNKTINNRLFIYWIIVHEKKSRHDKARDTSNIPPVPRQLPEPLDFTASAP